jgi:hypothetical protein
MRQRRAGTGSDREFIRKGGKLPVYARWFEGEAPRT